MGEQRGFWRWYLSGLVLVLNFRWVRSGWVEYLAGVLITILCSICLSVYYSPLWLLVVVPAGVTTAVHGLWRMETRRKGSEH